MVHEEGGGVWEGLLYSLYGHWLADRGCPTRGLLQHVVNRGAFRFLQVLAGAAGVPASLAQGCVRSAVKAAG